RDDLVTGVQTCALPISGGRVRERGPPHNFFATPAEKIRRWISRWPAAATCAPIPPTLKQLSGATCVRTASPASSSAASTRTAPRSEERRLGEKGNCSQW